jgi:hypothetical protein
MGVYKSQKKDSCVIVYSVICPCVYYPVWSYKYLVGSTLVWCNSKQGTMHMGISHCLQ